MTLRYSKRSIHLILLLEEVPFSLCILYLRFSSLFNVVIRSVIPMV